MSHTRPRCGQCSHRLYAMSCEDFDALSAEYGDRCAICGCTGAETAHGFLVIDHDGRHGYWAVRGLLCSRCNTTLDAFGHAQTPQEGAYLADPWWRRRFAALGLRTDPMPEPAVGAVVIAGRLRWTRTHRGWERPRRLTSWRDLHYRHGPHKIRVVSGQLALALDLPDAREIRRAKGSPARRQPGS